MGDKEGADGEVNQASNRPRLVLLTSKDLKRVTFPEKARIAVCIQMYQKRRILRYSWTWRMVLPHFRAFQGGRQLGVIVNVPDERDGELAGGEIPVYKSRNVSTPVGLSVSAIVQPRFRTLLQNALECTEEVFRRFSI